MENSNRKDHTPKSDDNCTFAHILFRSTRAPAGTVSPHVRMPQHERFALRFHNALALDSL